MMFRCPVDFEEKKVRSSSPGSDMSARLALSARLDCLGKANSKLRREKVDSRAESTDPGGVVLGTKRAVSAELMPRVP